MNAGKMLKIISTLLFLVLQDSYSIYLISPNYYYYGRTADEFSKCFAPSYGEHHNYTVHLCFIANTVARAVCCTNTVHTAYLRG